MEEMELLGVMVRSDLKWHSNTKMLCEKGYRRLWILRNLKRLGASSQVLVDIYFKQCRSVLELAVPVWEPNLTKSEVTQLERIQKTACAIILGRKYTTYKEALEILNVQTLEARRKDICLNFGKKALKSDKFQTWFSFKKEEESVVKTRNTKPNLKLKPVVFRTQRFEKSPIAHLTNMLNNHYGNT